MELSLRAVVVAGGTPVGSATGVLLHPSAPLVLALQVKDLRPLGAERLAGLPLIIRTAGTTITLDLAADALDELAAFDVPHNRWAEEALAALLAAQPPIGGDGSQLHQRVIRRGCPVRGPRGPLGRLEAYVVTPEHGAITAVRVFPRWPWSRRPMRYHVDQLYLSDAQGLLVSPGTLIADT